MLDKEHEKGQNEIYNIVFILECLEKKKNENNNNCAIDFLFLYMIVF